MKFSIYLFILVMLVSCKEEEKTQTLLALYNGTTSEMRVVFFPNEKSLNSAINYTTSFQNALKGDTLYLNMGDAVNLLWKDNYQLPTQALSEIVDSINILQIDPDSLFVDNEFIGFHTDSLKYKKSHAVNADFNIFTDIDAWNEEIVKDQWTANFNSQDETVYMFTFTIPDVLDKNQ